MATGKIKRQYILPNIECGYYPYSVNNRRDPTTLNTFTSIIPYYDVVGGNIASYFEANSFAKMQQTSGIYNDAFGGYVFSYIITNYNNAVMNVFIMETGGRGVWMLTKWTTVLVVTKIV